MEPMMTSEERLCIKKPPEFQCLNIDKYIKSANIIEKLSYSAGKTDDIDELHEYCSDINWEAVDIESQYEDLRGVIENLREWGNGWKELAKELITEYEPKLLATTEELQ